MIQVSGLSTRFRTYQLESYGMILSTPRGRNRRAHMVIMGNPEKARSLRPVGRRAAAGHLRHNRTKKRVKVVR